MYRDRDVIRRILYQLFGRVYLECVPLSESVIILNMINMKIMLDILLVTLQLAVYTVKCGSMDSLMTVTSQKFVGI